MTEAERARRAAAAAREVTKTATAAERTLLRQLLARLERLRTELLAAVAKRTATAFRQATARALLSDVDALIVQAEADLLRLARSAYRDGALAGSAAVDEALRAASLRLGSSLSIDSRLVTTAFDNTVDLLTETMQQFRNRAAVLVRRVALQGESSFTAIQQLATSIGGPDFDAAMFKAERIVRTELARTLNTSSYDRMVELHRDMPFLRKSWRASLDGRVRLGHREAHERYSRGSGIPVPDRFVHTVYRESKNGAAVKMGTATLLFPSDPDAQPAGRLAAATTILCRCSLRTDFDLKDLKDFTVHRLSVVVPRGARPAA